MTAQDEIATAEEFWRRYDAMEARLTAGLSDRMLELAGLRPGVRVLDLATGRGEPAIRAAQRVGPSGSVLGVDVSANMLAMAAERAAREGARNLELRCMDAASLEDVPATSFHAALCRWGLMYMNAPVAVLQVARRALAPGGVLVAAVWAEPERVPYFAVPRRVLARYQQLPPVDLASPGTFFYAEIERLRRDAQQAGLGIRHVEELDVPVVESKTASELITWTRAMGLSSLMAALPQNIQREWERDFAAEVEAFRDGGVLRLGGVTRVVVASAT